MLLYKVKWVGIFIDQWKAICNYRRRCLKYDNYRYKSILYGPWKNEIIDVKKCIDCQSYDKFAGTKHVYSLFHFHL